MQSSPRRDERLRELRRAAGSRQGSPRSVDLGNLSGGSATAVDRDARAASERLRETLKVQPPWSREVEVHRQKCRNLYLTLLFGHPLSTHAQSLEPLWANTTYSLISSYRAITSTHEAALPPTTGPGAGRRKPTAAHNELKKVLTRFRQVLSSEDTFYRELISRLVGFYQLQPLAREHLSAVSIGCPNIVENGNGGVEHGLAPPMSPEERKEKLGLVYKALICLGDLERYKEQYDERTRREAREGRGAPVVKLQEKYGKAWTYYEVAKGLIPDDGSAFNQLAVISTYCGDEFCCVYYYFRAMAVRMAFKNIGQILDKFLGKLYDRWAAKIHRRRQGLPAGDGEGEQEEEELDVGEEMKRDLLVLVAVLYRRQGLSSVPKLQEQFLQTFSEQLVNRQLPSESIVKITTIVIGNHWQARQNASLGGAEDPRLVQRRHQAEGLALQLLLSTYGELVNVSAAEVEEALRARAKGSAIDMDDSETEPHLHLYISAVLRRILPALRIFSKWLKLHLEHLTRIQRAAPTPFISDFWAGYTRLAIVLATLFPIDHLPHLVEPLEEDIDMRGFTPLAWGMIKGTREEQHDFHPNEEQLMRIADLQVDAKLLAQTASGASALSPRAHQTALPPIGSYPREKQDDLASVSTETEDDPVNMAMRATLAPSSVDDDELHGRVMEEDEEEEEIIVWGGRSGSNRPTPEQPQSNRSTIAQPIAQGTPTARDLLQNLVLESRTPPLRQSLSNPSVPRQTPGSNTSPAQGSPRMLFGGDANGSSIWTMTREESGRGSQRDRGTGTGKSLAHIWSDQNATPSPGATGLPGLPGMPVLPGLSHPGGLPVVSPPPAPLPQAPSPWNNGPRASAGGNVNVNANAHTMPAGDWSQSMWNGGYGGPIPGHAGSPAPYGPPGGGVGPYTSPSGAVGAGGQGWGGGGWNGQAQQGYPR